MVYVISKSGHPLMPTNRHGKVKHLLREGRARLVRREPFTIQLLYDNTEYTQPITLGVDAGTGHVGLSATAESREVFAAEVTLRLTYRNSSPPEGRQGGQDETVRHAIVPHGSKTDAVPTAGSRHPRNRQCSHTSHS